jgi:hypothetical protein
MSIIFSPDSLRQQVEAATGGYITVLYDDKGFPSYMRVIPKFRYEDLGMESILGTGVATAFLVDGQEKSEIFVSQYQASVYDGRAVGLPGKDPRTSINYDTAKAACEGKGPGWHLMSMHEWAAIALWCKANGFTPRGNTDYGRAHDAKHETAVVTGSGGRSATGGGPASWRHDGTAAGISDLVGNVWEWQDQFKLVDGEIFCTTDNDYTAEESAWLSAGHFLNNDSGTLTLANSKGTPEDASINSEWNALAKGGAYSEGDLMKRLMISPQTETEAQGRIYANTSGERLPFRGGSWSYGSRAGLAALLLNDPRSGSDTNFGFRPAFAG